MFEYVKKNQWLSEKIGDLKEIQKSLKTDGYYGGMEETFIASEML